MSTPTGWFKCKTASGKISVGFSCDHCHLTMLHGIPARGVFHCGKWEKMPLGVLPVYRMPAPRGNGLVGNFGAVSAALVGFDD